MVKAQKWLESQWHNTKERRAKVGVLHLTEQLEGVLDLADFTELWRICIYPEVEESKFIIINVEKDKIIKIADNVQEYLDSKYPSEKRATITGLAIAHGNLTGSLDLSDFVNLEELNCWDNQLTSLDLSNCPNLTKLHCSDNGLTNLGFLTQLDPNKLTELIISNNNLTGDLSLFSCFTNLKYLWLDGNSFTGSLAFLQSCQKLMWLKIDNTHITTDWEYLPESLGMVCCDGELAEQLKNYAETDSYIGSFYNYQAWRKNNQELIIIVKKIKETEQMLNNLREALLNQTLEELTEKALQVFIFESESEITELQKQSEQLRLEAKVEIPPKN